MLEDNELLRRYAEEKSEDAFAELVRRHIDFVYAAALRQARGNGPLAQDVTQAVFTDLARKSASLARHEVVVGWLHTATRFATAKAIRAESRWQAREREAHAMNEALRESDGPADWERLHPVLDEVLGELKERERAAILLRFFEKKPLAEVGASLSLTETAARSCVDRALDKMHAALARRGVTSTAAALGVALANQASVAAPAGLTTTVTSVALTEMGMGAAGWPAIFMSISKLQVGIVGALAAAGVTGYALQAKTNAGLRQEIAAAQEQQQAVAALRTENQQLVRAAVEAETLRQDDAEFARLSLKVAEAQQARRLRDEEARTVRVEDSETSAKAEVDRLNREGAALVEEFKALKEKSSDPSLAPEAKAQVLTAMKLKFDAIKLKQSAIKAIVGNVPGGGAMRAQEGADQLRRRDPSAGGDAANAPTPPVSNESNPPH